MGVAAATHIRTPSALQAAFHARLDLPADDWRALAQTCEEANVFYDPAFVRAALPAFGDEVGALVFRASDERLGALLPLRVAARRHGVPVRMLVGWTHPFAPLGVALIAQGADGNAAAALLDAMERDPALSRIALLPMLPLDSGFANALARETRRRGGRLRVFGRHARAALVRREAGWPRLDDLVSAKKRKELRRQARRLADGGDVTVASATAPSAVAGAVDEFLRLEASGWKGRAGTAAQHAPAQTALVIDAVTTLARSGQACVDTLRVGDRAIAAAIVLRSGDTAWFWKIAYDEAFARASPGVQLALALTERLAADPTLRRIDSCATPDHPMIDHLWRDRIVLGDVLIASPSASVIAFEAVCAAENLRRIVVDAAKSVRATLRKR